MTDDDETKRYWRHNRDPECFLLTESPLVAAPWHAVVVMTPAELAVRDAEKWDEGFRDGRRQEGEGEDGPRYVNPYRSTESED